MMKNINQIKNVFFFKLNIIPDQNQSQHLMGWPWSEAWDVSQAGHPSTIHSIFEIANNFRLQFFLHISRLCFVHKWPFLPVQIYVTLYRGNWGDISKSRHQCREHVATLLKILEKKINSNFCSQCFQQNWEKTCIK